MAELHTIGQAANDGELEVLRLLRDGLDESWHIVGNFSIRQGGRSFECDAAAFGPSGWAYLIEVKAWLGPIRGNDVQWELPALVGDDVLFRPNPVELTQLKARVLATVLREEDPPLKGIFIQPVVVLVSEEEPELEGSCADYTVLARDVVARMLDDPRPYAKKVPDDSAERASAVLKRTTVPIAPSNVLGAWELVEEHEAGSTWEVWSARARLGGEGARPMRLKRYWLDPLLTGESRQQQRERARRDLDALQRLNGADGAVPLVSAIEEIDDSFVVVTEWPSGQSLASMLEEGTLDEQGAEEVFEALVAAVASIHRLGVVHRNLSPRCSHFLSSGRVVVTDFDYARLPNTSGSVTQHIGNELANEYIAPEVRVDPARATKASDVWSVARIGLELFGTAGVDGTD
jgi:serine/threonine protein kinase